MSENVVDFSSEQVFRFNVEDEVDQDYLDLIGDEVELFPTGYSDLGFIEQAFPYSLVVPAHHIFDALGLKHGTTRNKYLETVYWCLPESKRQTMVFLKGEQLTWRRGGRQLFDAEHVFWLFLINQCFWASAPRLHPSQLNCHALIRELAYGKHGDPWELQDFAKQLHLTKKRAGQIVTSVKKTIYKANENVKHQKQNRPKRPRNRKASSPRSSKRGSTSFAELFK